METIKVFEMFSGYGGASWGLLKANIPFECVGISEIDKHALKCYDMNFPGIKNYGDCSKIDVNTLPDFDLLTGGFPCQDVSIAGHRDLSKGRTNLYQEILRIAKHKRPKYMLLENVKGLLSMEVDEVKLLNIIVRDLIRLGYGVCYKVLNSRDYGIPQNRERIWLVCKHGGWDFMEFKFPLPFELKLKVKDILEPEVDKKYYLSEKQLQGIIKHQEKHDLKGNWFGNLPIPESKDYIGTFTVRDYKEPKTITVNVEGNPINNVPEIGEANRIYSYEGISPTVKSTILIHSLFPRSSKTGEGGTWHLVRNDNISYCVDTGNSQAIEIKKTQYVKHQQDCYYDINGIMCSIPAGTHGSTPHLTKIVIPCLTPMRENKRQNGRRFKDDGEDMFTLTGQDIHSIYNGKTIRRLTPKECFRLMGFLNDEIKLDGISDSQKYKLAGNGWDIITVSRIFKNMFKNIERRSNESKNGS
jgi:DNA (cytosine-5)-methyltransferase 1